MIVKGIEIGKGMPKICVPIVETNQEDILNKAQEISKSEVDFVEWRVDFYEDVEEVSKVIETASLLQSLLGKLPLLFTFRTAKEGGEREISFENYKELLLSVAKSNCVDMVDVEVFRGYDTRIQPKREWRVTDVCNEAIRDLVEALQKKVRVIGSYHDFSKTPAKEEILRRLLFMDRIGVDIPKMAVMPNEREDVMRLMEATSLANRLMMGKPIVTMSMGKLGIITRIAGESFGSAITFGCLGKASAPGQIPAEKLKEMMELLRQDEEQVEI